MTPSTNLVTVPLGAPWRNGKVERAGAPWKDVFYKTVHEMQLQGLEDVIMATTIVTQRWNSFPRPNGFSPSQWVLGVSEIRIPGSLLHEDEAQKLKLLEAAEDPSSSFARSLGVRESARVAQIRLDNDSRVRRALLRTFSDWQLRLLLPRPSLRTSTVTWPRTKLQMVWPCSSHRR